MKRELKAIHLWGRRGADSSCIITPYEEGTESFIFRDPPPAPSSGCIITPYEEGTESEEGPGLACEVHAVASSLPMKRELKAEIPGLPLLIPERCIITPYEEGTERAMFPATRPESHGCCIITPYEEGTESYPTHRPDVAGEVVASSLPMKRELKG